MDPARDPAAGAGSALRQRIARWLRPPRTLRPTRAGWTFFGLVFGVGFAALNTGNNLLYLVLSLMLAFLVLSGVLSESALRGIRVRRRVPRELFAEAGHTVGLEITNRQSRVPAFAVVVEDLWRQSDAGEPHSGRVFALRIGPGRTETRGYRIQPWHRGTLEFEGFRVSTRFPFGLFSKALVLESSERALVYPAVDVVRVPEGLGDPRRTGDEADGSRRGDGQVAGLREFERGDPARRIHWRASLRRRQLLVRELEHEQQAEVEVRLRTAGAEPGDAFERSVRWAASELVALLESGSRVALRTDHEFLEGAGGGAQRARLLGFLARVEPSGAAAS